MIQDRVSGRAGQAGDDLETPPGFASAARLSFRRRRERTRDDESGRARRL